VKAMTNKAKLTGILLLAILFAMPTSEVHSDSSENRGDKIMLSLQIAKVKKEKRKIEHYKSIARQRKLNRFLTGSPLSSAQ